LNRILGVIPLAREGGPLAVGSSDDDLQGLFELLESLGERVEFEAELLVFEFEPAGTEAEDRPAALITSSVVITLASSVGLR